MNLALILTVLTLFTGVVVAVEKFLMRGDAGEGSGSRARQTLVEYSRSFFPVLLFVLIIRSFVFEPFRIPSGSMMPTLLQGDFIFVQKYAYGLRLPVTETKILETGEPKRGDVVVFRLPSEPSINYIKRIVGLPGDEIVYERHRLEHDILIRNPAYSVRDGVYRVPEGHYFVMGDNRDNSKDSRFIGAIPETHLVGEAVRIWMHMDGIKWPRWERVGTKIQ